MGSTLPEDTSREGCGVRVPGPCDAAGRQLGRLVIEGNNQNLRSGDPSFWHRVCVPSSQLAKVAVPRMFHCFLLWEDTLALSGLACGPSGATLGGHASIDGTPPEASLIASCQITLGGHACTVRVAVFTLGGSEDPCGPRN